MPLDGQIAPRQSGMAGQTTHNLGIQAARRDHGRLHGNGFQTRGRARIDENRVTVRPGRGAGLLRGNRHRVPGKRGRQHAQGR